MLCSFAMAGQFRRPETFLSVSEQLFKAVWPWKSGLRARLPQHFKSRYMEQFSRKPVSVHYLPDTSKYKLDKFGNRVHVKNIPLPITFPEESQKGLWGGEGVIAGYYRKHNNEFKPLVPRLWKPRLIKRIFYSEILDLWMAITVTPRTLNLVDQAYGFDSYILNTHEVDLCSRLGMRLKRKMLLALAQKTLYPYDPVKRDSILQKYRDFILPEEEADWVGLTLEEAEIKQEQLENQLRLSHSRPLKEQYMEALIDDLISAKIEDKTAKNDGFLSMLNPFHSEHGKKTRDVQ